MAVNAPLLLPPRSSLPFGMLYDRQSDAFESASGSSQLCPNSRPATTRFPLPSRMIEIPERQLRLKDFASSQRPSRASLLEELRRVPGGADPGLLECVARGAAFHHAGWLQLWALQCRWEVLLVRVGVDFGLCIACKSVSFDCTRSSSMWRAQHHSTLCALFSPQASAWSSETLLSWPIALTQLRTAADMKCVTFWLLLQA